MRMKKNCQILVDRFKVLGALVVHGSGEGAELLVLIHSPASGLLQITRGNVSAIHGGLFALGAK